MRVPSVVMYARCPVTLGRVRECSSSSCERPSTGALFLEAGSNSLGEYNKPYFYMCYNTLVYHMKTTILFFLFLLSCTPVSVYGQEVHNDYQGTWRARVLEVVASEVRTIPGIDTTHLFQTIQAQVIDGPQDGKVITVENDYLELKKGDTFYFNYLVDIHGREQYGVVNIDRRGALTILLLIFIGTVVFFGGWQGVRSLLALIGSFLAIFYILLPGLLHGWNPLFASFLVATGVLFVAIFFTHGFNRESVVAYGGTMIAVLLTGVFALWAVWMTRLSGFTGDESTYLNLGTQGSLDFTGLLLGAIIIGILGVLDDIAVTQAAVVSELYDSNPGMSKKEVYSRALRIGREHVGALVNTLVLAYTGASLPLLLYFKLYAMKFDSVVNLEIFTTEIVRAIVGSIGLILTVPIVTLLAVIYLKGYTSKHSHHHHHHHSHS